MEFVERFNAWMRKPYDDDMSVTGWFAFLGLIAVLTLAWGVIIRKATQ